MPRDALYYEDPPLTERVPGSIFLVGPSTSCVERTLWRIEAMAIARSLGYRGMFVVPEFSRGGFRRGPFDDGLPAEIPGMGRATERILRWETAGVDRADVVLAWMPFTCTTADDPESRPGFATRSEVSRAIEGRRIDLVLGMPAGALSGGQVRYHGHLGGYVVHETLAETVRAAVEAAQRAERQGRLHHGLRRAYARLRRLAA